MGFVKSRQELAAYYALKVREFPHAEMMGLMFTADEGLTRALLPEPLEQADMPGGLIFIAEYGETNLGPGYREAALFLRCKYQGQPGSYCLSMPIDSDPSRLHNGRDIYGFPKKAAKIAFRREGSHASGSIERGGIRFFELDISLDGTIPEMPPSGPTYLFKAMPRIDLEPGFDGPVFLASQVTEINTKSVEIGSAEFRFRPSDADPWIELKDMTPIAGFYIVSSNRMLPGKILAEVDGDRFLPHYFKMTDFFSGEKTS
jgi:acetoacetate decarboxylase